MDPQFNFEGIVTVADVFAALLGLLLFLIFWVVFFSFFFLYFVFSFSFWFLSQLSFLFLLPWICLWLLLLILLFIGRDCLCKWLTQIRFCFPSCAPSGGGMSKVFLALLIQPFIPFCAFGFLSLFRSNFQIPLLMSLQRTNPFPFFFFPSRQLGVLNQ